MFKSCDWTKYLINIPKHNYQSNNTCALTFVLIFSQSKYLHSNRHSLKCHSYICIFATLAVETTVRKVNQTTRR